MRCDYSILRANLVGFGVVMHLSSLVNTFGHKDVTLIPYLEPKKERKKGLTK